MEMLAEMIQSTKLSVVGLKNAVDESIKLILNRMDRVEEAVAIQQQTADNIEQDMIQMRSELDEVKSTVTTSEEIIRESQLRIAKQCNLVLMGISENEDAVEKAK